MKTAIAFALKSFIQWIKVVSIKLAKKGFLILLVIFGLGLVGLLPPCPFRLINQVIASEQAQAMTILRYLPVFIPIFEILAFMSVWISAILGYYAIKVLLRVTKVVG